MTSNKPDDLLKGNVLSDMDWDEYPEETEPQIRHLLISNYLSLAMSEKEMFMANFYPYPIHSMQEFERSDISKSLQFLEHAYQQIRKKDWRNRILGEMHQAGYILPYRSNLEFRE